MLAGVQARYDQRRRALRSPADGGGGYCGAYDARHLTGKAVDAVRHIDFDPLSGGRVIGQVMNDDGTVRRPGRFVDDVTCRYAKDFTFGSGDQAFKAVKSCGRCWYCTSIIIDQRVGLIMMETDAAHWQMFMTLTYAGPDRCPERAWDGADEHLVIKHLQDFVKKARSMHDDYLRSLGLDPKDFPPLRVVRCGEKGEKYGRAHFHLLIYGYGPPMRFRFRSEDWMFNPSNPQAVNDHLGDIQPESFPTKNGWSGFGYKRVHIAQWPHGFVQIDLRELDTKRVRYVLKYMQKGRAWRAREYQGQGVTRGDSGLPVDREAWISLPRRPQLGAQGVLDIAKRDAELGILRMSFSYMPPGALDAYSRKATSDLPGRKGRRYTMPPFSQRTYLAGFAAHSGVEIGDLPGLFPGQVDEYGLRAIERAEKWWVQRSERDQGRDYLRGRAEWRLDRIQHSVSRWRPSDGRSERSKASARRRAHFSGDPEIFDELDALDRAANHRETMTRFRDDAAERLRRNEAREKGWPLPGAASPGEGIREKPSPGDADAASRHRIAADVEARAVAFEAANPWFRHGGAPP